MTAVKKYLSYLAILLFLISPAAAQDERERISVTLFVDRNSLTLYIPSGQDEIELSGFGYAISDQNEEIQNYYLETYENFKDVDFAKVATPICFRLHRQHSDPELPTECQSAELYEQVLVRGNVFWYDDIGNEQRTILLMSGDNASSEICSPSNPSCELTFVSNPNFTLPTCVKEQAEVQETLANIRPKMLNRLPELYGGYLHNLGDDYRNLANCEHDPDDLKRALLFYIAAAHFRKAENASMDYAATMGNIGITYRTLAPFTSNPEATYQQALAAFDQALHFFTIENSAQDYAQVQHNLGNVYRILAIYRDTDSNLEQAVELYLDALRFRTFEAYSLDHMQTKILLGRAYLQQRERVKACSIWRDVYALPLVRDEGDERREQARLLIIDHCTGEN